MSVETRFARRVQALVGGGGGDDLSIGPLLTVAPLAHLYWCEPRRLMAIADYATMERWRWLRIDGDEPRTVGALLAREDALATQTTFAAAKVYYQSL